jgi:ABC-type multidrug transport system ATPase subunit
MLRQLEKSLQLVRRCILFEFDSFVGQTSTDPIFPLLKVKDLAASTDTICIATIHQPNYETFSIFDKLLLLSGGKVKYNDTASGLNEYLTSIEHPTPEHQSPADHAINLVNTEFFHREDISASQHLEDLHHLWDARAPPVVSYDASEAQPLIDNAVTVKSNFYQSLHKTGTLIHRNGINYARNILGFGIRSKLI